MKMNMNLNLTQQQKLVMTPELKQAIEILQFSSSELNEFINNELLENPVISSKSAVESEPVPVEKKEKTNEIDWKKVSNEQEKYRGTKQISDVSEDVQYENFVPALDNLIDHLLLQLKFFKLDEFQLEIASYLIQNIDDKGYLDLSDEEVMTKYKITEDEYLDVLNVIQSMEPAGIGARNLVECLLIQVQQGDICDEKAISIIENHLDDLASNRIQVIAKKIGESNEKTQKLCDYIKTLEPKPGRRFARYNEVRYIVPDVVIEKIEGKYVIVVNDSTSPKLLINKYYRQILNDSSDEVASEYIQKKLNSALKLIKSIEQRRNTIYRVVEAIIDFQIGFFEDGSIHLKKLTLKDVADVIEVHESTVSRAVNGKYLQCSQGVFELKHFFKSGVSSEMGEEISSESIKKILKEIIDKENPKKPFSDQNLTNQMVEIGINISRRTVAKYRDEMLIASSSKRKRF